MDFNIFQKSDYTLYDYTLYIIDINTTYLYIVLSLSLIFIVFRCITSCVIVSNYKHSL